MKFQLKITLMIGVSSLDVDYYEERPVVRHHKFTAHTNATALKRAKKILNKLKLEYPKRNTNETVGLVSCDAELHELRDVACFSVRHETRKRKKTLVGTEFVVTSVPTQKTS